MEYGTSNVVMLIVHFNYLILNSLKIQNSEISLISTLNFQLYHSIKISVISSALLSRNSVTYFKINGHVIIN